MVSKALSKPAFQYLATPINPDSCRMLTALPLEIREEIYFHALLDNSIRSSRNPTTVIVTTFASDTEYWGRERMTRLFRVCRQFHCEALSVLYSRFTFEWAYWANGDLIQRVLHPLSTVALECMRSIKLNIILRPPNDMFKNTTRRWRHAFSSLVTMLPGLKVVKVRVLLVLARVAPWHPAEVVENGLEVLRPFKMCKGLEIVYDGDREMTAQKIGILEELSRRIEMGQWT